MKNIIEEKPTKPLHGGTLFSSHFVLDVDIKGKIILDIGCGYGWVEVDFLGRGVKKIYGIEKTDKDLETAKKYIKDDRVEFGIGSAIQLPFNDGTFDTAVSWEVIEHIPKNNELTMLMEVNRILKKGGTFYLSTPNNSLICKICDPAWWLIQHRHYSIEYLTTLAERSGFLVSNAVLKGGWWEIISIINLYIFKWIFRRRAIFEKYMYKKLDKEFNKEKGFANVFLKLIKT